MSELLNDLMSEVNITSGDVVQTTLSESKSNHEEIATMLGEMIESNKGKLLSLLDDELDDSSTSDSDSSTERVGTSRSSHCKPMLEVLVAQFLGERRGREVAESKLERVDALISDKLEEGLDNLRASVIKMKILMNEPNQAKEDIRRSLSEKNSIILLLEGKLLVLQMKCEKLQEQLSECFIRQESLEKSNAELSKRSSSIQLPIAK